MKQKSKIYCRLEHLCLYKLEDRQSLKKTKSIFLYDEDDLDTPDYATDVYIEEYNDFSSVKARIIELNQIWRQRHPEKERYWTKQEKEKYSTKGIINSDFKDKYLSVMLYNRWQDLMVIGISYLGWIMPGFSNYTMECINKKIKQKKLNLKEKSLVFYTPEWTEFSESDFISENAACYLIKQWLDTGQYTKYFVNKLGELKKEKYISTDCTI